MRVERARTNDLAPLVLVAKHLQRLVTRRGEDRHRPCAVVAGQRQQRERPERRQYWALPLRLTSAEEPRVVRESGVRMFFMRRSCPNRGQPLGTARLTAGGVDDEVGAEFFALRGSNAGHVRCAGYRRRTIE